ncbi:YcnI family protein [Mycolicibacter heraklionensis]|uniref:YcnI family protein n=1 Tax=Mycolicibacter heraklionensis TaxID=512402 RepID=UPI0007EEF7D4|nr:nuclear export factor GLE1 [Mycolicibacter heraklionensis]
MSARMRATALAAAITAASVVGATPAWAHVHASSPGAVRGGVAMVTFEVPNESPNGSATTELTVTLPDVASARTETKPGWTARLDRDPKSGAVHSVTWTATAGAGIGADQFGLFRIAMRLPDAETVNFPSAQRYADGTEVRWDETPPPGGGEAPRPVPTLQLGTGPASATEHHAQHPEPAVSAGPAPEAGSEAGEHHGDNAARLLGGAALLVAALAATIALGRRRA